MVFQQRSRPAFGEIFPLEAFHDKQAVKALDKMGTCASIGFADALVKAFEHATKAQREPSEHDSRGDEHPSDLGNHDGKQRKRSDKLGKHARRRRHNRGDAGCHDTRIIGQAAHPFAGVDSLHAGKLGMQHFAEES